jgi:hypothetical protein
MKQLKQKEESLKQELNNIKQEMRTVQRLQKGISNELTSVKEGNSLDTQHIVHSLAHPLTRSFAHYLMSERLIPFVVRWESGGDLLDS